MPKTAQKEPPSAPRARMAANTYRKASGKNEPDWSLIEQFLPLVKAVVSRMRIYFPPHADMEDIYSVAIGGLINAIRRCDPEKTESFASYAALRVRGAVLDELRKLDWLPRSSRIQAKRLRQVVGDLEQKLMRPATEEEIAQEMEMSLPEYQKLLDQLRPITLISLDSSAAGDTQDGAQIHEIVSDETEVDARDRCEKHEMVEILRERINELPEVPRKVLMLYYYEGMRLAEIAEVFGLTESRICQIHSQAIVGLRVYLNRISRG